MVTSYLVLSLTYSDSAKLMDKFIYALRDTDEIKRVDRARKIVYMTDGTSYMFRKNDRRSTEGCIMYHDSDTKTIGWMVFSSLIDSFTTKESIMKTFGDKLKEVLREKDI